MLICVQKFAICVREIDSTLAVLVEKAFALVSNRLGFRFDYFDLRLSYLSRLCLSLIYKISSISAPHKSSGLNEML